jgi:hypothetical protein
VSDPTPGPLCPRCRRPIAAWRLEHCIYCGEKFPPGLRDGFAEPDALKWVDRPAISPDAARQLELMKVVPLGGGKLPRSLPLFLTFLALPVFAILFFLLYSFLRRYSATTAVLVLLAGAGCLAYLVWAAARKSRRP